MFSLVRAYITGGEGGWRGRQIGLGSGDAIDVHPLFFDSPSRGEWSCGGKSTKACERFRFEDVVCTGATERSRSSSTCVVIKLGGWHDTVPYRTVPTVVGCHAHGYKKPQAGTVSDLTSAHHLRRSSNSRTTASITLARLGRPWGISFDYVSEFLSSRNP